MEDSPLDNLHHVMKHHLNKPNKNTRRAFNKIYDEDIFTPVYDVSLRQQKEIALERMKRVLSYKVVSVRDFLIDPENIFTVHEMVIIF